MTAAERKRCIYCDGYCQRVGGTVLCTQPIIREGD